MPERSLYCRPSDIKQPTYTLPSGSADALYPVANLGDLLPYKPFKVTGTSGTIRGTFSTAQALEAIALLSHRLGGTTVTITNAAGLNTTLAVPANSLDGLSVNAFKDLRGLGNLTSSVWELAFVASSAPGAVGELLLIETVRTLYSRWGLKQGQKHDLDRQVTEMGVPLTYELGTRARTFTTDVTRDAERTAMFSLHADARSESRGFWIVPDDTINDCIWARFAGGLTAERIKNQSRLQIDVDEIGLGPAVR
jgi:hypothetical protein